MKKIMKVLVATVIMSVLFAIPVSAASSKWNSAVNKYNKYVSTHSTFYDTKKFYDINKDGKPEMILTYPAGVRGGCTIYTIKSGKVKRAGKVSGLCGQMVSKWKGNKKYIVIEWSNGASDSGFTVYKLKSGKLKKVTEYRGWYDYSTDSAKFSKNNKSISRASYNSAQKKIGKSVAY